MHEADEKIVRKVLTSAIHKGYTVSLWDGGDYALRYSTDVEAVMGALQSTDQDNLVICDYRRTYLGSIALVHGNEPGVIIADHSDNPLINEIVAVAAPEMDEAEAADAA